MGGRRKASVAVGNLPRHAAFYSGVGVGALACVLCLFLSPKFAVAAGANCMFITYLSLTAIEFRSLTAEFLRQRPDDADAPVFAILFVTTLVVVVAVIFMFLALNSGSNADMLEIAASITSVLLGWFTVHTMAAPHYAHEYYRDAGGKTDEIVAGLKFPGEEPPDGGAFLYFSYVLGMTAQVADVAVTSRAMRRLVTIHGVFSFFFNTVIVAATVNVVVTIAGG